MTGRLLGAMGITFAVVLAGCGPEVGRPAQRPMPAPSTVRIGYPVREGDSCKPIGALGETNTGVVVTCRRAGGRSYPTWERG